MYRQASKNQMIDALRETMLASQTSNNMGKHFMQR